MNKKTILICAILTAFAGYAAEYETIQVKSSYSGSWSNRQTKLVSLINNYSTTTDGYDDFTSCGTYRYLRTDSTGFYYVKKIDERWWIIDPNGYAGINMAVTSFTSANIQQNYDIIKQNGYNGTGNFLSSESQTKSGYNLQNHVDFSYTRRLNFYLTYKNVRHKYYTTPENIKGNSDYTLVLDPYFARYCDSIAQKDASLYIAERDLLGWYTDNELNFNQDQLQFYVRDLPEGDPSRDAALAWAAEKGLSETDCSTYNNNITEAVKEEFAIYLAEAYYKTVSEAIHKVDTNHLILGSRLHGRPRAIQGVVDASHKYMDITSVNFYDRFTPNEQIAKTAWTNDHPCIVGEFYIKDINQQNSKQSGAGWYVNGQTHRGYFYQNTCLELLANKCYIGWQYFRFADDDDGSNKGIVNTSGEEYTEMTQYMEELNKQVYQLCDFYDGQKRRPQLYTETETLIATEDTYIIAGSTQTDCFGDATELEVRYSSSPESNRREAFFKFNLEEISNSLPYLKCAELQLTCTKTDNILHNIFVSGITDNSWQESTLCGALRSKNTDWKNGYNRLDFIKDTIETHSYLFNVTNWISNQDRAESVSFKVHDLLNTGTLVTFASSEYANEEIRPKLILTFWTDHTDLETKTAEPTSYCYPNPANDRIYTNRKDVQSMAIFNLNGQPVYNIQASTCHISHLPQGMYIVQIKLQDGNIKHQKISKQ